MARRSIGPLSLSVTLLAGCTPAPRHDEEPVPVVEPASPVVLPSTPPIEPALPVEQPSAGCPPLRVFADFEDLCDHGLMPMDPIGRCERKQAVDQSVEEDVYGFPIVQVPALGGVAELVATQYVGAGGIKRVTTYLALRRPDGYVLLAEVAGFDPELNYPAIGGRFEGSANSLELQTSQEFFEPPKIVKITLSCDLDETGDIRCNGACPSLAIAETPQLLDCGDIEKYDWTRLPTGEDVTAHWSGNYDDERLEIAAAWLVKQGKKSAAKALRSMKQDVNFDHVALARDVYIGTPRPLTILKLESNDWVLLDGQVPLVASDGEIRVGQAPGGLFVVSHAGKRRRIHRLNLSTHELEPVAPGLCP